MGRIAIGKARGTVWKSECGLLFSADMSWETNLIHYGTCYIGELEYSDEVGVNPVRCPYGERCKKSTLHPSLHPYYDCVAVLTNELYNYETSGDKAYLDCIKEYNKNREILKLQKSNECGYFKHTGHGRAEFVKNTKCPMNCGRDICVVTNQKRDRTLVHIYGEREYISNPDTLIEHKAIVKGIRITSQMVSKDTADKLIKEYETMTDTEWGYYHRYPKPTRFYTNKRVVRDLGQDLADIREGIEVLHDSDLKIAAVQAKRDRKKARLEAKKRKAKRQQAFAERELSKLRYQKFEQVSMFK